MQGRERSIVQPQVVEGTNIVSNDATDGFMVWLDLEEADPTKRYKMAVRFNPILIRF